MLPSPAQLADRLLTELDAALATVGAPARASRTSPATGEPGQPGRPADREESARLMRVNHAGEIAAQALYRGQALVARDPDLRARLLSAADEEHDHLAWCEARVSELGQRTSLLGPAWYAGSFMIGALAGLAGDKASLSFLAETEHQVAEHLQSHLHRLPPDDRPSRQIVETMRSEEIKHGHAALAQGGRRPDKAVANAMRLAAGVMKTLSYRI